MTLLGYYTKIHLFIKTLEDYIRVKVWLAK